jgi:cytochrome c oxidase subunit 2
MRTELSLTSQSIFTAHGEAAAILRRLGVTLTVIALVVTAIMTVLIVLALRRRGTVPEPGSVTLEHYAAQGRRGVRWIIVGTVITLGILGFAAIYSVVVLVAYPAEVASATMTVRITGYQYWWKVEYLEGNGRPDIVDANELHIPAGARIKLELAAADVIHSFWVPGLAGKTDLIPGQQNVMWIEADHPGAYRGQCAEYCGMSHANMRLEVFAHTPADFAAWQANERKIPVPDSAVTRIVGTRGCAACHRLAGQMNGQGGPDLTHVAERATIAAGVLANTPDNLRAWLLDPQVIKPGTRMPRTGLTPQDVERLVGYLGTLH